MQQHSVWVLGLVFAVWDSAWVSNLTNFLGEKVAQVAMSLLLTTLALTQVKTTVDVA